MGAYGGGGFSGPMIGASTAPGSFPPAPAGGPQMPYQLQYQGPGGFYTPPQVAYPVPSGYPAPGQPQALTAVYQFSHASLCCRHFTRISPIGS